jgi:Carboxypeptidase regulatory-like domain
VSALRQALRCAAVLAVLPAVAGALNAARADFTEGQPVQITGTVTDAHGAPLADLTITLEASRNGLDWRWLKRVQRELTSFSTTSNARGEFSLSFPWSAYYNRYDLLAGVPVRRAGGERVEVLARSNISSRIGHGSPIVATLAVQDTRFLNSLREFLAAISGDEQRQVYETMGKPDAVERVVAGARVDATWWYYEAGKCYRFENDRLEKVETFDPIRGF